MGGGHRPRHAFLVVAHAVGGCGLLTATALSVEALGRVVPGLDPRIDIGHAVTALGVGGHGLLTATAPAVSVRVSHACRGVRRDRSRSRALPNRSRSSVRFSASPARLRYVEAGRLARRGPQKGVEAFVSQPPVAWSSGGRPSCSGWGVHCRSPVCFLRELAKFFMGLSGSSSLGAPGVLAGVTASAAASGGVACPSSPAAGAATFCAATVTPAGAGVLPAAPAAGPGVSGDRQRQGMSRSRGRCSRSSGDGSDGRA